MIFQRPDSIIKFFFRLIIAECPRSNDRMERFACPTSDFRGRYRCIDDRALCDGFFDCPGREDESPDQCLFYKTVSDVGVHACAYTERAFFALMCVNHTFKSESRGLNGAMVRERERDRVVSRVQAR